MTEEERLQKELTELSKENGLLKKALEDAQNRIDNNTFAGEVEFQNKQLSVQNEKIKTLNNKLVEKDVIINKLQIKLRDLNTEKGLLTQKLVDAQHKIANSVEKDEIDLYKKQISVFENKIRSVNQQIISNNIQEERLNSELRKLQKDNQNYKKRIEELQDRIADGESIIILKKQIVSCEERINKLNMQLVTEKKKKKLVFFVKNNQKVILGVFFAISFIVGFLSSSIVKNNCNTNHFATAVISDTVLVVEKDTVPLYKNDTIFIMKNNAQVPTQQKSKAKVKTFEECKRDAISAYKAYMSSNKLEDAHNFIVLANKALKMQTDNYLEEKVNKVEKMVKHY